MIGRNTVSALAITVAGSLGAGSAGAAEKVDFILNWIAGGDHAPYYYAKKMGWYEKAGIDLNIQQGKRLVHVVAAHRRRQESDRPRRSGHRAGDHGQGREAWSR